MLMIDGKEESVRTFAEVVEIEHHIHNTEHWFGIAAGPTGTNWGEELSLTPYRAITAAGDFGSDADDEALVLGADDTPIFARMVKFDLHRIMISAASNATPFVLRIVYGTGTMGAAEAAHQYTEVMITEARKGAPIEMIQQRVSVGCQVWIRAKNATNNATIDFFIGLHEYEV